MQNNSEDLEFLQKILSIHHTIDNLFPQRIYLKIPVSDYPKAKQLRLHFDIVATKFYIFNNTVNKDTILQIWKPVLYV